MQSALVGLEPLSLGPIRFRTWHVRYAKEHESKSQKNPPARTCGEGLRSCWPRDKPVRRAREFSVTEAEGTRIQFTAQGPPAGPWGPPAVSCAGATPDRSDWSRPRTGAGEKCPSTTAISSTLIAIGCLFALREDSAGGDKTSSMIDLCASVSRLSASRGAKQHCTRPRDALLHSSLIALAKLERLRAG